jgi:acetylornithine deacetylase/succinyl-diaminopimelate desuccinylase-like protein
MRRLFRSPLLVSLALCALASQAKAQSSPASSDWPALERDAVEKLSAYIHVDTTNPPGNEIRAAQWYAKIFEAEGIPFQIAESAPGRGNIVARLKGSGSEPALILLNHMDVVPVSRDYWTEDPFAGLIRGGYLWGRGSIDMKGIGILQLLTFLELHRLHVGLKRDVIFIGTADEEAGGDMGAGWVVKNRPEWIAGAGFMLTEGATSLADDSGKPIYFAVGSTEKTPAWLRLTATGRSGHGSIPIPDSAPNHLIAALDRLRQYRPSLELTLPVETMLRTSAAYEPEPWRSRFADPKAFLAQPDAYDLLEKRPDILDLLRNTISITSLKGSNKTNIIPSEASAELDCRLLSSWTVNRWVDQVRSVINDPSIRIEVILDFPPAVSSTDTPLFASIEKTVHELNPGAGMVQSVAAGFTDSHFFREKGIIGYGFGPFAITREDRDRVHGDNERIPVKNYTDGLHVLWNVVYDFSRAK